MKEHVHIKLVSENRNMFPIKKSPHHKIVNRTLAGLTFIATLAFVNFLVTSYSKKEASNEKIIHEMQVQRESSSCCDLFSGKWVYDKNSHPLYNGRECSFMFEEYACEKYGRNDFKFQNWRWQPHDCDLPRFNAKAFLEKIRGKKLVFVGDSLNKNQFTSLLCILESSLVSPPASDPYSVEKNLVYFEATEYNATIGFYWSPFLVESNNDDLTNHNLENRIVRIKAIENHAKHWTDADILVFDSYVWWTNPTITLLWGSFRSPDAIYKTVEMRHRSYEMALNTWAEWLEVNVNKTKTKLFFMSLSPTHNWGENWNEEKSCYNETEPILKQGYHGIATDRGMMDIMESTIHKLGTRGLNIQYLNITQLSDYRKDAHPSIYKKFHHNITEEQLKNPTSYSDCIHWCLPGLPDTWNQILYAYIMHS